MKTDQHHISALCILLALPAAAAQCSSTFTGNIIDLHELKPRATSAFQTFSDGTLRGNSVKISSLLPTVSLNDINSIDDFGCNADIENAYVFKLRLMRGDSSRFFIRNGGVIDKSWQIRKIESGAACPGVVVKNSAALNDRCTKPGFFLNYKEVSKPIELLIIVQKTNPFRQISLWWSYTPNPTRQVNTCQLANNGECDYDSGKCLMGTDCSDCGGSNCQATECISAYEFSDRFKVPATCDDPEWKSLPTTTGTKVGSKGPWDCQSLEREMRMDCSGCRCEIQDPCTDEVKRQCRASNREICERGSGECGECLDGYTLRANTTICEPNPCDDAAKEACRIANKETCDQDFRCGGCLPGFGKVSDICVDVSKCPNSDVPSRMVMLMDTSGSLDNPLFGGRYGNYREMKNLAMDLVNVFPINEFAIRSFSSEVTPYPASGAFLGKSAARAAIKSMTYDNQATYTGDALEHTISLLEDKTDSFNIVVVFTDGKATDGLCKEGETCNHQTGMCSGGKDSCKLLVQAPMLQELPDRNGTVTVVSVGFGQIDADELSLIASGEGSNNTIIAQGTDASAGLVALHKLLGSLVEKVCLNLPVDCVFDYTDWSECPDECGQQYQFSEKRILVESKNGGESCPTDKQMRVRRSRPCPPLARCTTTPTTSTTTTLPTVALPPIIPVTAPVEVDANANVRSNSGELGDSSSPPPLAIILGCVVVVVVIGIVVGGIIFVRRNSEKKPEPKKMTL